MNTRNLEIAAFLGLIILITYLAFSPRNGDNALKEAKAENQYYSTVNRQQDSLLNEVFTFLNQIEENLDSLQASENLITSFDPDLISNTSFQERVFMGLEKIKARMATNRQIIDSLESHLHILGFENTGLRKTITRFASKLDKKDESIALLEESLANAHGKIRSLGTQVGDLKEARNELTKQVVHLRDTLDINKTTMAVQGSYIREQEARLRKGFLISGNLKELKKSGVISTSGGVAGIGSVPKLASNMNQNEFVPIDIEHLTVIPINGGKAELVSSHPESSYKITQSNGQRASNTLEIIQPEDFWSTSRYLVVLTK